MKALRVLAILLTLGALLVLMAKASQQPVPVAVQWGSTTLSTTAAVATTLLLLTAITLFYLGQFTGWLFNLPQTIRSIFTRRRQHTTRQQLLAAFAALAQYQIPKAQALSINLHPEVADQSLYILLKLQLNQPLTAAENTLAQSIPELSPLLPKAKLDDETPA